MLFSYRRLLHLLDTKYITGKEDYDRKMMKQIEQTKKIPKLIPLYFPSIDLCTENGAMVAWTAIEKLNQGISDNIEDQEVIPRWPLGRPLDDESLFKN